VSASPEACVVDRDNLITSYRPLCSRAARKFVRSGNERSDLEQVAAIGLIKAADRFDPALGAPFAAYAWSLILGELMHYVRDNERTVRAPRRLRELERRWSVAERELCIELGREPNDGEVAAALSLTERQADEIRRYRYCGAIRYTEELGPSEQLAHSYTIDEHLDRLSLQPALALLTELERTVIQEIYERDIPIGEVADQLGYSRRHITRLHQSALKKLERLG
jgi:RNA polymerase sigma-B factor